MLVFTRVYNLLSPPDPETKLSETLKQKTINMTK